MAPVRLLERVAGRGNLKEVRLMTPEVERLRDALLAESDLFHGIGPREMGEIVQRLPMATCRKGKLIYSPEETGEALFILKSGTVRIYRLAPDGRKLVLAVLGPGTAFGEMSVLGQSMTGSFAEAIEDATVCIMSREDIEQILMEHPAVAIRMIELMARRAREAEDRLQQMAFDSVPQRLVPLLLSLADRSGRVRGYSHQDLADMIGASRETVSRALNEMKDAGVVQTDRRELRLNDPSQLEQRFGRGRQ
jgi:CRP/FNR family cyclic AMP-dependent transcriptional regulator